MVFTNSLSSYYEKFLATGEVKCIDEEIPFEIPKGWEWSKLSNVIELLSGQDFIPEKYNSSNQGIPYITGASNIVNGNLAINRWTETPTVIGKLGDLLIVCKGSGVGKMCICNVDKIHIARQIQIIRNFSNAISLSYVKSVVEANLQTIISNAQGVIPGISREHILNLLIPLPPTNEQYEIDKKLQEILPFIDRYAKSQEALDKLNVELLGNLKKSILQEAVQGRLVQQIAEEGTGEELLEQIKLEKQQLIKEGKLKKSALTDSVIFRGDDNKYYEQINGQAVQIECDCDFPYSWSLVRLSSICALIDGEKKEGQQLCLDAKFLRGKSTGEYQQRGKFVHKGDNIILVDGENSGEVFTVPCDGYMGSTFKQLWVSSAMHLPYVLNFILFYKELLRKSKRGAAIPHLNKEIFYSLIIGMPPYREQQRISARIDELSQLFK